MKDGTKKDLKVLTISFGIYIALLIVGTLLFGTYLLASERFPILEEVARIYTWIYLASMVVYMIVRWITRNHRTEKL